MVQLLQSGLGWVSVLLTAGLWVAGAGLFPCICSETQAEGASVTQGRLF